MELEAIEQRSLDRGFLASRVPKGELGHNYMRMRLSKFPLVEDVFATMMFSFGESDSNLMRMSL